MSNQPPPVPTKKILIVDDDAVVIKALSMKLAGRGFQVVTAMDGTEGVKAARKEKPDLIVLDVSLPSDVTGVPWDGFRIVEWLRRMDETLKTPIIIITGGDPDKFKGRSEAIGAVAFFQKPVDNDELLKVINKTLGVSAPKPEAGSGSPPNLGS